MTIRRGVGFVFALIGLALAVSVAALVVLYVLPSAALDGRRARAVGGRAGAAPRRRAARAARPTTWWGSSSIGGDDSLQAMVERAAPRQDRPAHHERGADSRQPRQPLLGQAAGAARRGARLPPVREAGDRVPRVRRRPRVLPGQRGRQGLPAADELARPDRHAPITRSSCAACSTRSARIRTSSTSATTRRPPTSSPRPA